MKNFSCEQGGRVVVIRLDRGDLVLESIRQTIKELKIKDGTVVCGYGTMDNCRLHGVTTTSDTFPAVNTFMEWKKAPIEVVSMSGVIADGQEHIHAVVSEEGKTVGGHLETGCTASYCLEIVIYEHKNMQLVRKPTGWGPDALDSN